VNPQVSGIKSTLSYPTSKGEITDQLLNTVFQLVILTFEVVDLWWEVCTYNYKLKPIPMKRLPLILIVSAVLTMASCQNTDKKQERDKALNNLESYVDSVSTEVDYAVDQDWAEIENRYKKLKAEVDAKTESPDSEFEEKLVELETEFKKARADGEQMADEMKNKADKQLSQLKSWLERKGEKAEKSAEKTGESIDESWKESMNWLEENYKNLEEDTKKEFDKVKEKINSESKG